MTELIGKTLGLYQIVERIGEGGMAVVYKGYQAPLDRYVAIKVLRGELTRDQEFLTRFRREALAVARLDHPNILHVYDAGVVDGVYYIAMAYSDGGSLRERIDQGPLEVDLAVSVAARLAAALDHAHSQGLIHRDVKPSNILLRQDTRPLLADFGIAKVLHEVSRLTRTGVSIGTSEYMAPEHALMQPIDGRTDIYALGIVLYEMLCGEVPFTAETQVVTLYRHVNDVHEPLRQRNSQVPGWLEAVVDRALAKHPEDRYQRARDMEEDLMQRRAPGPSTAGTPTPRGIPLPGTGPSASSGTARSWLRRRPLPVLVGSIGLLLVALLLAGAALLGGDGPANVSPTRLLSATALPSGAATGMATVSPTVSPTPSPSPSSSPSASPSPSPTATTTRATTPTPTASPTPALTAVPTQPPATEPQPTPQSQKTQVVFTPPPTRTKSPPTNAATAAPRPSPTPKGSGITPP